MKITYEQAMALAELGSHIRWKAKVIQDGAVMYIHNGVARNSQQLEKHGLQLEIEYEDLGPPSL